MDKEKNTKAVSEENIYCLKWKSAGKKGDSVRTTACSGNVCVESGTGADRVQCGICERIGESLKCCGNYAASAVRDVCSGDRDLSAALPGMEDWLQASDRYGSQFYLSW